MRLITGSILLILAFFGTIFFSKYKGTLIDYKLLWYIGFVILGIAGIILINFSFRISGKLAEAELRSQLNIFKESAECIEVDLDKCEFRDGSFTGQVEERDRGLIIASTLVGSSASLFATRVVNKNTVQSYLIYSQDNNGTIEKFVSHNFPLESTTLKFHVLQKNVNLYVDRNDRNKYFFELKNEI